MARKTQISKKIILETALKMLIRDGYSAVNIKTLSKEIGCSTQPLVWHFDNMEGLRKALAEYAVSFANKKLKPLSENAVSGFSEIGNAYVDIAFDMPNLFKYLFLNEGSNYCMGTFEMILSAINNQNLIAKSASFYSIPIDKTLDYLTNTIVYSHGLLVAIVSGTIKVDRQTAKEKVHNACCAFLLQAGGDIKKAQKENNFLKNEGSNNEE